MKKIFLLIVSACFVIGCEDNEANELNRLQIDLITDDSPVFFSKTVILFQDDRYLVKTNFNTYINAYPFGVLYGYDDIKEQAIQAANDQDILLMTDYLYTSSDSVYIFAYHLEHGSCLIFDKSTNQVVPEIEMEEYSQGGPMTTTKGRRFYVGGVLFLETVDLIS